MGQLIIFPLLFFPLFFSIRMKDGAWTNDLVAMLMLPLPLFPLFLSPVDKLKEIRQVFSICKNCVGFFLSPFFFFSPFFSSFPIEYHGFS